MPPRRDAPTCPQCGAGGPTIGTDLDCDCAEPDELPYDERIGILNAYADEAAARKEAADRADGWRVMEGFDAVPF